MHVIYIIIYIDVVYLFIDIVFIFIYLLIHLLSYRFIHRYAWFRIATRLSRISMPSGCFSRPGPMKQHQCNVVSVWQNFQVLQTVNSESLIYLAKSHANRPSGAGHLAFQPCAAGRKCLEVQTVQSCAICQSPVCLKSPNWPLGKMMENGWTMLNVSWGTWNVEKICHVMSTDNSARLNGTPAAK